jgi:molybdenum cofactor guanylyltransferase
MPQPSAVPAKGKLRSTRPARSPCGRLKLEIAILAGGRSRRMGTDKTRLRLGRRTLLGHVRAVASTTGWPVRVIRRDLKPGCGPLGGIYTALMTTRADVVLFLACDMPFVTVELLRRLVDRLGRRDALFCRHAGRVGFPFALKPACLHTVKASLADRSHSLQSLATNLRAPGLPIGAAERRLLTNVNTPAEWVHARTVLRAMTVGQHHLPGG